MTYKTPDGSVIDANGKVLFFSLDRFIRDIVKGECCFICGASRSAAVFNDEHVIPDWIVRKYDLHSKRMWFETTEAGQKYATLKIPCCKPCNDLMSQKFETPISRLVSAGLPAVLASIKTHGLLFFHWLALIFFKFHYRDRTLRLHLDTRKGTAMLGETHDWAELHHIHCVARAFYTGSRFEATVLGSIAVVQAIAADILGPFDYVDRTEAQTMLLRLGEIAFLPVLNDSQAAWTVIAYTLTNLPPALSGIQLRELMARLAWIKSPYRATASVLVLFSGPRPTLLHPRETTAADQAPRPRAGRTRTGYVLGVQRFDRESAGT